MDSVLRAAAVYLFVFVLVRLSGRRTMGEMDSFDFVLLLIIGEATQQALLGQDFSLTHSFLVVLTLILIDTGMSLVKHRSRLVERIVEGVPLAVVYDGKPKREYMDKERISEGDVLRAARAQHGLETLSQVKVAFLEADGKITVVPK
ncbi:MAG TPA: YetF domain-containing protein [Candidatus Polarisedimenticolaceae bacterium]|nr:YetF domain-containing protein [Candidatus Polarisedimenticolaceae bacterium]